MQRWTISSTDRKGEDTRRTSLSSSSARMKRAAPPIVQTVPIRLSAISRLNTSRLALVRSSDSRNFLMPAAFSAMSGSGRLDFLFLRTTLRSSGFTNLTMMGGGRVRPWASLVGFPARWADTRTLSILGTVSMA